MEAIRPMSMFWRAGVSVIMEAVRERRKAKIRTYEAWEGDTNEGKAGGGMTKLMTKRGEEKDPRINDESSQGWRNVHVLRQT